MAVPEVDVELVVVEAAVVPELAVVEAAEPELDDDVPVKPLLAPAVEPVDAVALVPCVPDWRVRKTSPLPVVTS